MPKRDKPRKRGNPQGRDYTPLDKHKRNGSRLIPPLATLPQLKPASWMNDRLPEMLWAVLLISTLPRERALDVFRATADFIARFANGDKPADVTHSGLAALQAPTLTSFLAHLVAQAPDIRPTLRPLLLFPTLPASVPWATAISLHPSQDDWDPLALAVSKTLFHQSQESTDCRWLRLICMGAAGNFVLPTSEMAEELNRYPHYGDMRKVRPTIRSAEGAITAMLGSDNTWPLAFWAECFANTPCFPLPSQTQPPTPAAATTIQRVREVYHALAGHAQATTNTTAVDPVHDTAFGLSFYSLAILEELLGIGVTNTIAARTSLRTLVEVYITLSYLVSKNDPATWASFRVYGAGQAKLAYLKLDEVASNPRYVETQTLEDLANEDLWQEFLQIDLGHWQNANLRQLSSDSGTKLIYDKYYPWTSAFAHGHWGPVRDAVFDTCGNPLHRLHRIPRAQPRTLPDLVPDACEVVDLVLEQLSQLFPIFPVRVSLAS